MFVDFAKRVAQRFSPNTNCDNIIDLSKDEKCMQAVGRVNLAFMSDLDVIKEIEKRGLFKGPDGMWHKRVIKEVIEDIPF